MLFHEIMFSHKDFILKVKSIEESIKYEIDRGEGHFDITTEKRRAGDEIHFDLTRS